MVVTWSKRPERTISQQTFDEAVLEIVDDLGLSLQEAIDEARSQFQAQDVSLVGIRDTIIGEGSSPSTILDDLNRTIADRDADAIVRHLTTISDDEARSLADLGLIGALLFLCDQHIDDLIVIEPVLNLLLIALRATTPSSVPEPGLVALLRCLRRHADHVPIQTSGLRVLTLAITAFEPHKSALHSNGFNEYLCDVLGRHRHESAPFLKACTVLKRYVSDDDRRPGVHPNTFKRARELAADDANPDAGVLAILVDVLKANSDSPIYAGAVCAALRSVAVTDAICRDLSQRALNDLIATAQRHFAHDEVIEKAFALFKILSRNDQVKGAIVDQGGLDLAVLALSHHSANAKIVNQVLAALSAITLRQPDNCLLLAQSGAVPLLVGSMSTHPGHVAIQRAAISAIRNMVSSARTKELASMILEEDAEQLICRAHDTHEQCKDVAYAALRDLGRPYKATWAGIDS